ncbi:MAG: hypothetical protein Q7K43_02525 [Candidatus Woesearchaeota archaeon]|nr:hypothetical protein [Candidatus Woesearchaeota archaeon]
MPDPVAQQAFKTNLFFWFVLAVHIADVIVRMSGQSFGAWAITASAVTYLFVWMIARWALPSGNSRTAAILSVAAWLIPLVGGLFANFLSNISQSLGVAISLVIIFAPVWIVFLIMHGNTRMTSLLGTVYIGIWLLLIIIQYSGLIANAATFAGIDYTLYAPGFTIQTLLKESWQTIIIFIGESKIKINEVINETKQNYEFSVYGDVYTGRVESQQGKRLGVDLGPLQVVQQNIRENTPVTVFARLQAQTLDNPVNIKLFCNCCERESPKNACGAGGPTGKGCTIRPKAEFTVTSQDSRDVECRFEKDVLEKGQQNIGMRAVFSFTTSAYLRTYFMDSERVLASQREKINPLDQYKIKDKNPIAIFTPGPINIGMALSEAPLPIQIDRTETEKFLSLQISATNQWTGKITDVKAVNVFVPEGVEIVDVNGYSYDTPCELSLSGNECSIPISAVFQPNTKRVGAQIRLGLRAQKKAYDTLLGKDPVAVRFFKTNIEYDYEIEKSLGVTVT